jgi:Tol biopolymer transport system component
MAATRTAGTTPGIVLGTIGYMSPEQVRGQAVDHRCDIFSFGTILYEMLSGERAFKGDTPADTMSAILNNEPRELTAITGGVVSPALERVARHCLEKEPGRRFQSARDLAFDLEALSGIPGTIATDRHPALSLLSRRRRWQTPVTTGLVGLACGGLAVWLIGRSLTRTAADTPVVEHVARITHESGFSEWPTWSPDGSLFAFSSNRNGNFELYVGRVEGGQEVVYVTNNPADDVQPAFSPDGTAIAFVSTRSSHTGLVKIGTYIGFDMRTFGGDVWVTPALGGQARRLAEDGNFPVWHPSSRTVLYVTGQDNHRAIFTVSFDGGPPKEVLPSTASTWEITRLGYSPDARWITFETSDRQLFAMPAAGGRPTALLRGSSHVWDPTGRRIYYVNHEAAGGTRIEAAELQQSAATPTVARVLVVGVSTGTLHELAIAADGKQLLASGGEESLNLTRVPLAPGGGDVAGPEEDLSSGQVRDRYPTISSDGRRIAVGSNRIGDGGLWIVDVPSARWQRVQLPRNTDDWITQACWAHDGQHLVVKRFFLNGTGDLWYVAIYGSSTERLLPPAPVMSGTFACAFSPDGRSVVHAHLAGGFSQLFLLDVASRRDQPLTRSPSDKYHATWSPDGRWVTFSANTDATVQVWRIPAAGGQEQRLTTGYERMIHLFYSPDGRWLYVQPSHRNIHRMPADGGPLQPVTRFPESGLFIEEPTISPDGRYLAYNRGHGGSSLWMLTIGTSSSQ